MSARLTMLVRPNDTVARMGGDEFVVLRGRVELSDAEALGQRIGDSLRQPISVGAGQASIGASVGALTAPTPTHGGGPGDPVAFAEDLLRRADTAMYAAKRGGGGVCVALGVETWAHGPH